MLRSSLVEVLVGFGILGIGVTSVITLFPLLRVDAGAGRSRTTAPPPVPRWPTARLRDVHQHNVVEPEQDRLKTKTGTGNREDYFVNFSKPAGLTALSPADPLPRYPVYVDPMGYYAVWPDPESRRSQRNWDSPR